MAHADEGAGEKHLDSVPSASHHGANPSRGVCEPRALQVEDLESEGIRAQHQGPCDLPGPPVLLHTDAISAGGVWGARF